MVSTALGRVSLHPAERRRIQAMQPPEPMHEVKLRPLGGGDGRTLIVSAREEKFLPAIFADLQADDWRARLAARRSIRRGHDGKLELGLPIHRHFQLVMFEAVCNAPGYPPVDPLKLVGMGLVLRRIDPETRALEGWLKAGEQTRGWGPVDHGITPADDPDPDPAQRLPSAITVNGQLAALLASRRGAATPLAESILPLFIAPGNVCEARRRTIVFGIVPVASSEKAGTGRIPDFSNLEPDDDAAIADHISAYLKQRPQLSMPNAGQPLDPLWNVLKPPPPGDVDAGRRAALGTFLYQLQTELGAFDGGTAARGLLAELAKLQLVMRRNNQNQVTASMPASQWVTAAAKILVGREPNTGNSLTMPLEWPAISSTAGAQLSRLARACMTARFRELITETPKFDRDEALYNVRGFVRVEGHAHCAPQLVWSDYSEQFRILPWWDSDAPASRISLPALRKLKGMKPNVTFEMPPELANLLRADAKKLSDGEGSPPSDLGIGWLCSFSIPIITICAFICLNIFLTLFDIFLSWMAWIKICIPYPKRP